MKKEQLMGTVQILIATLIWGCAFVAQSVGMEHIGPMTFQAARSLLAVLTMLAVIPVMDRDKTRSRSLWQELIFDWLRDIVKITY